MAITDNFDRADGAPGANWVEVYLTAGKASAGIVSNQFRSNQSFTYSHWRRTEATFPDDQYAQTSSKFDAVGFIGGQAFGRVSNDGDGYLAGGRWTTTISVLDRIDNGTTTSYLTEASRVHVTGTYYTIKVQAVGSTITAFEGGTEIMSATDSTYTSGKPGIFTYDSGGSANEAACDDFECTDASGGAAAVIPGSNLLFMGVG